MSTLSIHTASLPHVSARHGVAKFVAFFTTLVEVFADAQEMARDAQKRYPFAVEG